MSDNYINQVTLDYLMNKEQYNKSVQQKVNKSVCKEDRKFYKKRIIELTKDLLSKTSINEQHVLQDVKYAFNNYIKVCIDYFKTIDNNDIIQEEYKNFTEETGPEFESETNLDPEVLLKQKEMQEAADKLLMRSIILNPLDTLVKRTYMKPPDEMIAPKQKDIDLTNPALKDKGIIKKTKKEKENIC